MSVAAAITSQKGHDVVNWIDRPGRVIEFAILLISLHAGQHAARLQQLAFGVTFARKGISAFKGAVRDPIEIVNGLHFAQPKPLKKWYAAENIGRNVKQGALVPQHFLSIFGFAHMIGLVDLGKHAATISQIGQGLWMTAMTGELFHEWRKEQVEGKSDVSPFGLTGATWEFLHALVIVPGGLIGLDKNLIYGISAFSGLYFVLGRTWPESDGRQPSTPTRR